MTLFRREYRLSIGTPGSEEGRVISELNIKFNIVRTSDSENNKCSIEVFNLSSETRAVLETSSDGTNNPIIIFQAQYAEDVSNDGSIRGFQTLFTGQVVNSFTTKNGVDLVTLIEAQDGYLPLREGITCRNFPAGVTRREVLNALIQDLGVAVGEIRDGGSLSEVYSNGVTIEGPIRIAIDKLLRYNNIEWSIQDDAFFAVRKDLASRESVLDLNVTSGLIGSPQSKKGRGSRVTGQENEADAGLTVQSLLAPSILPNRRIRVTSNEFPDGATFKVTKVTHEGEYRSNNWMTTAELLEFV